MAKPSPDFAVSLPRVLVLELWGLGDLALAMPFLRTASTQARVTLLAKPHAAPLLARFAPGVEHVSLVAPWTAFAGKYRLHRWPWAVLTGAISELRRRRFEHGVSARHDPRDHLLLALAGTKHRLGFPRAGSRLVLTRALTLSAHAHRAEHWRALAAALGWDIPPAVPPSRHGRRLVVHTGAGRAVRAWPRARFDLLATRLRAAGWDVEVLDDTLTDLDRLLNALAGADRFIGNDSGPGHLAALLGVPTFTIFGPQLPSLFAPQHPHAGWIEGAPCRYKPCFDACRFATPHCIEELSADHVAGAVERWLAGVPHG